MSPRDSWTDKSGNEVVVRDADLTRPTAKPIHNRLAGVGWFEYWVGLLRVKFGPIALNLLVSENPSKADIQADGWITVLTGVGSSNNMAWATRAERS